MFRELLTLRSMRRVYGMSPDAVEELQAAKLRTALANAYERVPFYRARFQEAGVHPADIRSRQDLAHLPETTKGDLQTADLSRILARGVDPESCLVRRTNGSTGTPLAVYLTPADQRMRSLVELRCMVRLGLRIRDFAVCLGPETQRKRRLHERLGIFDNARVLGTLPPEEQLRQLRELQPDVLWFYPTALRALLPATDFRLRDYLQPRMLITSAEVLDDLLRRQVRDDLGVEPFSAYGTNEIGRIAMECPARQGLHINTDHVVLESWADGRPAKPGEVGAALVTTLNTFSMPLLRYRLGDRVRLLDKRCSCGSPLPLMDMPGGREGDVLLLPSGRIVSTWAVSFIMREYLDVVQFRMVQEAEDHLRIQVVTRAPWPESRLHEVQRRALDSIGEPIRVDVEPVDELPADNRLKFRYFISRVAPRVETAAR